MQASQINKKMLKLILDNEEYRDKVDDLIDEYDKRFRPKIEKVLRKFYDDIDLPLEESFIRNQIFSWMLVNSDLAKILELGSLRRLNYKNIFIKGDNYRSYVRHWIQSLVCETKMVPKGKDIGINGDDLYLLLVYKLKFTADEDLVGRYWIVKQGYSFIIVEKVIEE